MNYPNIDDKKYATAGFSSPTTAISNTREKNEGAHIVAGHNKRIEATKHTDIITVLLVDDHMLMREGLRQLFSLEEDIRVIGEAVDGIEALQKIRQLRPDVVLMDVHMPGVDGITVTQQVVRRVSRNCCNHIKYAAAKPASVTGDEKWCQGLSPED